MGDHKQKLPGPPGAPTDNSSIEDLARQSRRPNTADIVLQYLREFEQREAGKPLSPKKWTIRRQSTRPLLEATRAASTEDFPLDERATVTKADKRPPTEVSDTNEYQFVEPKDPGSVEGNRIGQDEDSLNIGKRYRIVTGLGMGGMGSVFKVVHRRLGKTFALKIINPHMSTESKMQRLFYREAQVLSQLDHPHIVAVTDFGTDEQFGTFLVMEYLHGESLHERINQQNRLTLGQSLQIALQVARALHHMHQRELVHCDIKAENVFLCRQAEGESRRVVAKLIDFGLTRRAAEEAQLSSSEIGGTPMYAPPEQIGGAAPQPSMDIYAVGVLLYEMLTGQPLFVGSLSDMYDQKAGETFPRLSETLDEDVDPRLESLVTRTLRAAPGDRHPTMGSLVYELRTAMEMLGVHTPRRRRTGRAVRKQSHPMAAAQSATDDPGALYDSVRRCPIPVFLVDADGCIAAASRGFCAMAQESIGSILGQRPGATRLANIYPEIDEDIAEVISVHQPVQRTVQFTTGERTEATLVIRLVPWRDHGSSDTLVWGNAMPLV